MEAITRNVSEIDVLLLQPHLNKQMLREELGPVQNEFWDALNQVGSLGGDQPTEPNIGLLYVASSLESKGYTVELIDFHLLDNLIRQTDNRFLTWEDIRRILMLKVPKVVGISSITCSIGRALGIAALCKELYPHSPVVLGGIHPTVMAEEIIEKNPCIDFVVQGEGEISLIELMECLDSGADPKLIQGLVIRDRRTGRAIRTGRRTLVQDLDILPFPAYHLVPQEINLVPRVLSARGCVGNCAFCSPNQFFGNRIRYRSPSKVVDEIELLRREYGCGFFVLGDLTFMARPDYGAKICQEIMLRKLEISWWCQTRVDILTRDRAQLLKAAGCVQVALGIESASQHQLDLSGKKITPNRAIVACQAAKSAGLSVESYWIIGLPGESLETVFATIKMMEWMLMEGLIDVTHISVLVPYPGTNLYNNPHEQGIKILSDQYDEYLMNCDDLGSGVPVYETTILSRYQIYSLWELAQSTAAKCFRVTRSRESTKHNC